MISSVGLRRVSTNAALTCRSFGVTSGEGCRGERGEMLMCPRGAGAHFQIRRDIGGRRETRGLWKKKGPGSFRNHHASTSPPPVAPAGRRKGAAGAGTCAVSAFTRRHCRDHMAAFSCSEQDLEKLTACFYSDGPAVVGVLIPTLADDEDVPHLGTERQFSLFSAIL